MNPRLKRAGLLLLLPFSAGIAAADISFDLQMDRLQMGEIGDSAPAGSLVFLVADTAGDGFAPALSGELTAGSGPVAEQGIALDGSGGNDLILWRGELPQPGILSAFITDLSPGTYGGLSWSAGVRLAVYWFPGLTTQDTVLPPGEIYGRFSAESELSWGDVWTTPSDGASGYRLYALTSNANTLRGPLEPADLVAGEVVEERPGVRYHDWIAAFPEITGSAGEPGRDFSGDGVPNLLKFAFNLDPRVPTREGLSEVVWRNSGNGASPALVFRRRSGGGPGDGAEYVADGLRYLVEVSPDLQPGSWRSQDEAGNPLVELLDAPENLGEGIERVAMTLRNSSNDSSRLFLRLRLELLEE